MRVIVLSLLTLSILLCPEVGAATNPGDGSRQQLAPLDSKPNAQSDLAPADPYPHITNLENAILGQSFLGQPLSKRLTRMEVKAFGSSSSNPDLSERTDAL